MKALLRALSRTVLAGLVLLVGTPAGAAADERVRPAAVAGSWYPGDATTLGAYVDRLLAAARPDPAALQGAPVRALVMPHAAYGYSGATAAAAAKLVQGHHYKRVVVLGPAHRARFRGLSIPGVAAYETPLGRIPLDTAAVEGLRTAALVTDDPQAHREEHSIEMQLPLLQRALAPGWRLVPVLVGWLEPGDHAAAAALLRPLLDDQTLLVVSTDFTHYGPRYHYLPFPLDARTPQRLEQLDRGAVDAILARDATAFLDYQKRTGITICGYQAVAILLELLPARAEGKVVAHATSGALSGNYRQSVSYYALAFRSPVALNGAADPPDDPLSASDWQLLDRIARLGVRDGVARNGDPTRDPEFQRLVQQLPDRLKQPAGAFVTLREHGRLRGCIGYIVPVMPLYQAVYQGARNAARHDVRFLPVSWEELPALEIGISVLSPLRPIATPAQFRIGRDGIVLEKDDHKAVYLPEVADLFDHDPEQMLAALAVKAGLDPDAWKDEDAHLFVFTTQEHRQGSPGAAWVVGGDKPGR